MAYLQLKKLSMPFFILIYPSGSKASRELANSTESKNPHTPVYGVKEFVRLSVCLLQTLTPIIMGLAKQVSSFLFQKQLIFYFLTQK